MEIIQSRCVSNRNQNNFTLLDMQENGDNDNNGCTKGMYSFYNSLQPTKMYSTLQDASLL